MEFKAGEAVMVENSKQLKSSVEEFKAVEEFSGGFKVAEEFSGGIQSCRRVHWN